MPFSTKKPSLQKKDWVFSTNLHSLPPKTHREAHPGGFSGLRIILILAPSHPALGGTVVSASFVPDNSGVAVPDSHGVPLSAKAT